MSKLARLEYLQKFTSEFTNAVFVISLFRYSSFLVSERIGRAGARGVEFIHLSSSEILSSIGLGRSLTTSHRVYDIIIYDVGMTHTCIHITIFFLLINCTKLYPDLRFQM